jgi:Fe2+ or Zn2+ uptake regulation protein
MEITCSKTRAVAARRLLALHDIPVMQNRLAVISLFMKQKSFLQFREIEQYLPGIERTTIFRALQLLWRKGLLSRITYAQRLYYHFSWQASPAESMLLFTCLRCQETIQLETAAPELLLPPGYRVLRQYYHVKGTCAACRENR